MVSLALQAQIGLKVNRDVGEDHRSVHPISFPQTCSGYHGISFGNPAFFGRSDYREISFEDPAVWASLRLWHLGRGG